jgi:hypothetical protein
VVNVADCANVYVRLITFKLCLCHDVAPSNSSFGRREKSRPTGEW